MKLQAVGDEKKKGSSREKWDAVGSDTITDNF